MGAEQGRAARPLAPHRRGVRSSHGIPPLDTRGQERRHLLMAAVTAVAAVMMRRSCDGAEQSDL
jgi:hypothetical protein